MGTVPQILSEAVRLHQTGQLQEALKLYQQVLREDSQNSTAMNLLAVLLSETGHIETAYKLFIHATALSPNDPQISYNFANFLSRQGQLEEAEQNYKRTLVLEPSNVPAVNNLGVLYRNQGRMHEAAGQFRQAVYLTPKDPQLHYNLALALKVLGDLEGSRSEFETALKLQPTLVEAHYSLCLMKKFTDENDPQIRTIEMLLTKDITPQQRVLVYFMLGRIYDNLKHAEKAFSYFHEANTLSHSLAPYDLKQTLINFKLSDARFTDYLAAGRIPQGSDSAAPIFILGMPRSGTTLVEQILCSHPKVEGAGESSALMTATNVLEAKFSTPFPEFLNQLEKADLLSFADQYIAQIRKEAGGASAYITDKMPDNFKLLGLAAMAFPKAKIIHCMRDPVETCWSIFKTPFENQHPYAYRLEMLGIYYHHYTELMKAWHRLFPGRIYDISYEALVEDQEAQTRKLLAYCELDFDDACLDFHKTERAVNTASNVQVRSPIYSSALHAAAPYSEFLQPLREALATAA